MRPEEIRNHVRRDLFQPFRVFVSDGSSYDVKHPELILVGRRDVIITVELGDDDIPERFAYCDPVHITRIEPVNGKAKRVRNTRRR